MITTNLICRYDTWCSCNGGNRCKSIYIWRQIKTSVRIANWKVLACTNPFVRSATVSAVWWTEIRWSFAESLFDSLGLRSWSPSNSLVYALSLLNVEERENFCPSLRVHLHDSRSDVSFLLYNRLRTSCLGMEHSIRCYAYVPALFCLWCWTLCSISVIGKLHLP